MAVEKELDPSWNTPALAAPASHAIRISNRPNDRADANKVEAETSPSASDGEETARDEEEAVPALSKHERGWRRIVRNLSPSWFSTTMGTGAVGVLLISVPYQARWLHYFAIVFFALNTILFLLASIASILRYTLYPEIWFVMLRDPFNSLFLATIPVGFATLVRLWMEFCVPAWGEWALTVAWIGWMIDSIAAVAITVFMSYRLISPDSYLRSLSGITAVQLIPIAATVTASVLGGAMAEILPNHQHALGTLITSYVMWGLGMPLALTVIVMYYQRLVVHKLPSREVIVSCFLPLGPLGYGGYGIMLNSKVALTLFPITNTLPAVPANEVASILYVTGFLTALFLWSFALIFFVLAVASLYKIRTFPFNMGWWGFTFPLAVYSLSTMQIGKELESAFFRILGTVFATTVIVFWFVVAAGTVRGAWNGKLFNAPCLAELKQNRTEAEKVEAARVQIERITSS